MKSSLLELPATERYKICQERVDAISTRLINAIHLSEMCEIVVFSNDIAAQIPHSYAANSFSLLQRTLIKQLALSLSTIWDPFIESRFEDRVSLPSIVDLIDEEVISLAKARSYDHWYDGAKVYFGPGFENLSSRQLGKEQERLKRETAESNSQYVEPCIRRVIERMPQFKESKLIKDTRDFRNKRLAHHIDLEMSKRSAGRDPTIKWNHPRKLLLLSLWCCHNLSLGLRGHDQNFQSSFEIAKLYNRELWDNCSFDIPT